MSGYDPDTSPPDINDCEENGLWSMVVRAPKVLVTVQVVTHLSSVSTFRHFEPRRRTEPGYIDSWVCLDELSILFY